MLWYFQKSAVKLFYPFFFNLNSGYTDRSNTQPGPSITVSTHNHSSHSLVGTECSQGARESHLPLHPTFWLQGSQKLLRKLLPQAQACQEGRAPCLCLRLLPALNESSPG